MLTITEIQTIGENYSKDALQKNFMPVMKRFFISRHTNEALFQIPLLSLAYNIAISKKTPNKNDLAILCFAAFYNKETYQFFLESMPKWFGILIEKLLWERKIHRDEVEKIVDGRLIKVVSYGDGYEYLPELYFFEIQNQYSYAYTWGKKWEEAYKLKPVSFSIPPTLRKIITTYYPQPEGYILKALPAIEIKPNTTIFNAEAAIFQEFAPLASYYLQGNIKYSEKGRPNMASLRKIQRTLAIKEFYDENETALHPVRTMLLFGMLHGLKPKDISDDTPTTIKNIFTSHFTKSKYPSAIANFIINQVKGMAYFNDYDFSALAAPIFWDIVNETPTSGWVTWNSIEKYCNMHFLEPQPLYGHHLSRLYYDGPDGREEIDNRNRIPMLQFAFLKGCFFLFATYGLLEIAHTSPDTTELGKTFFSEYDGLQAFKLTALGSFVLGKSSTYEPPAIENGAKLVFDEENLIIRAEGNLNLMATLLGNYVEKITPNRFAFRPALFLKDCKNAKQVENKITLFRKSLNTKLPPFWEYELEQMVAKAKAVTQLNNLLVFKLNQQDKNLLRTIAQDSLLKSMVIKAEHFYVLIDSKNKTAFKNRLLEMGYLVDL
jgi:hypothetical protein